MSQTRQLLDSLKRIIKLKGSTYAALAKKLSVSEATIKRSFGDEEALSLRRLEQICDAVGINFAELVRLSEISLDEKPKTLNDQQEEALSTDLILFKVFYLLLRQWSPSKIEKSFKVDNNELQRIFLKLDKLNLIEFHPDGKIKLLTSPNIRWKKNGPIYKMFEAEMKNTFLSQPFDKANEKFTLLSGTLSPSSQAILVEKMNRFERELEEFIATDLYLEKDGLNSVAIILALGPVKLSVFE